MQKHGKQWGLIKAEIPNRTAPQIRTHAQKFFIKLGRKVPRDMDAIEFMKSKPASYFLRIDNAASGQSASQKEESEKLEKPRAQNPNKRKARNKQEDVLVRKEYATSVMRDRKNGTDRMALRKRKQKKEEDEEDLRAFHEDDHLMLSAGHKSNHASKIIPETKSLNPPQNNIQGDNQTALIRTALQKIADELQASHQSMYGEMNEKKNAIEADIAHANCWNLLNYGATTLRRITGELSTVQQYSIQQHELSLYQQQPQMYYPPGINYASMNPPAQNGDGILQRENLSE